MKRMSFEPEHTADFEFALNRDVASGDEGIIEGWASAFDVLEPSYGTKFRYGAFTRTLQEKPATKIKMLTGHTAKPENLVGVWEQFREETKGLFARGRLLMKTELGRDTFERVKAGALDALSVGFAAREWEDVKEGRTRVRHFTNVELGEISFVVFPGNPGAELTAARGLQEAQTPRELEHALRDAGLSRSQSRYIVSLVDKNKLSEFDPREVEGYSESLLVGADDILAALREANQKFGGK